MANTAAFSGHRNLKDTGFDSGLLERVIRELINNGTKTFLCGMAVGFDLSAAETVLSYKEKEEIKLIACLPCPNQSERYSSANKLLYEKILNSCDEVVTVCPEYTNGCMFERDRYMVDNSDLIVSFLRKEKGGTFYTVNYARRQNKKIIEL